MLDRFGRGMRDQKTAGVASECESEVRTTDASASEPLNFGLVAHLNSPFFHFGRRRSASARFSSRVNFFSAATTSCVIIRS